MDYGTFFFTNIVSVTVYTVSVSLVAWHNRRVVGVRWFAGSLIALLVKLILQGLEGKAPALLSGMVANELYLISVAMQMMGLRWFVIRKPLRHTWPFVALGVVLAAYTGMFLGKVPYSGNVLNIPFIAICAASAWILLKHGHRAVSRASAAIVILQMVVSGYRALLTNLRYVRPWDTVRADADPQWLYSLAVMAFLSTCMVMCYLWYVVTELGRELAEQARTDPLTGALNRRALAEAAQREMARSVRYGRPLCMIVLDVDNFKNINDSQGHAAGDCALQGLVHELKLMLRGNDLLARTGGEEFSILLPDTNRSAGIVAAERIRRAVEKLEVTFDGKAVRLTVSAGVAQLDPSEGGWESMLHRADTAMYQAKELGRNSVCHEEVKTEMAQDEDAYLSA